MLSPFNHCRWIFTTDGGSDNNYSHDPTLHNIIKLSLGIVLIQRPLVAEIQLNLKTDEYDLLLFLLLLL